VGSLSGTNVVAGGNNTYIGSGVTGPADENQTVRVASNFSIVAGASACYIGGIYNQMWGPADMAVRIGSNGKLGTVVSSARFKKDIKPMDEASESIFALNPVTFRYKRDATENPQFGLVAEEVAKVNPDLVVLDSDGKPITVRYEAVDVMLLNEFLKEHKKVEEQQATVAELKSIVVQQRKDFEASFAEQKKKSEATAAQQQKEIEVLTASVKEQAAQIQKVTAQLEVSKTAPQMVLNNP
jgi:trimeric autotransporter adhesin